MPADLQTPAQTIILVDKMCIRDRYYSQSLYVDNTDYFSVPTELSDVYIYNINLTQDSLSTPSREIASISSDNRVKTYNLTFMSRDFVAGDANQDDELNIRDAAYIAKMLAAQQGLSLIHIFHGVLLHRARTPIFRN